MPTNDPMPERPDLEPGIITDCRRYASDSTIGENARQANQQYVDAYDELRQQLAARDQEIADIRVALWMSHGHIGMYGDDGELQCGACLSCEKPTVVDYKRTPLLDVVNHVLRLQAAEIARLTKGA